MNSEEKIEECLKQLKCHFNWNLNSTSSSSSISCDVNVLEDKLLVDIADNPPVTCQAYLLLAFAYAVGDINKTVDYDRALDFIEKSEKHAKSNAETYLAVANKLWILKTKRDTGDNQSLLTKVQNIEKEFTDEDKSDICVAHAFSLARFPPDDNGRSLEKYKEAVTLNPSNGEAYFGIGQMLGKIRRIDQGLRSKPSDEELNAFEKSMELWPDNPLPFVFYALAFSYGVQRGSSLVKETIPKMDHYMTLAISKADNFCSVGSSVVFKWCAKGYKTICLSGQMPEQYLYYLEKQKECVDKAVELSPNDSSVLHEAGIFYSRVKNHLDPEKAKYYLMKSVEFSLFRKNFWADMDIVGLRRRQERDFDALSAYCALETKYSGSGQDHRYLAVLHESIAREYESLKKFDSARKEYVKSVSYEPNCNHSPTTADRLPKLNEQFVKESRRSYDRRVISATKYIRHLYEAVQTYEMFVPKKSHEAKKLYELILRLDGTKTDARKSLCDILLELKLYDQCLREASQLDTDEKDDILSNVRAMKAAEQSS